MDLAAQAPSKEATEKLLDVQFKTIVVGVDDTEAESALNMTQCISELFNSQVFAVHALPELYSDSSRIPVASVAQLNALAKEHLGKLIASKLGRVPAGWNIVPRLEDPASAVLAEAADRHADLIIV